MILDEPRLRSRAFVWLEILISCLLKGRLSQELVPSHTLLLAAFGITSAIFTLISIAVVLIVYKPVLINLYWRGGVYATAIAVLAWDAFASVKYLTQKGQT